MILTYAMDTLGDHGNTQKRLLPMMTYIVGKLHWKYFTFDLHRFYCKSRKKEIYLHFIANFQ